MTGLHRRIGNSMSGRLFVVLFVGISMASLTSLALAEFSYRRQLEDFRIERTADRIVAVVSATRPLDAATLAQRAGDAGGSVVALPAPIADGQPDKTFTRILRQRLAPSLSPQAIRQGAETCARAPRDAPPQNEENRQQVESHAQALGIGRPECWTIEMKAADGAFLGLKVNGPPPAGRPRLLDPLFLLALLFTAGLLSWLVARLATRPLHGLAAAAERLGGDLQAPPMPETGPREVAEAAHAMNTLQSRLNDALDERTQILAAIAHDLQTPLTRLRLRVEKVDDADLKSRLLADLAATQQLVREGLELARNQAADETFEVLDLDSLLASIVDDEADAGRPVSFSQGCRCDVRVRPAALHRCLTNLIDNAVTHGGDAVVSARKEGDEVWIHIEDEGPGIPVEQLERVMTPFVRLETSRSRETGGSGLGLAIADRLARETNGRIELANRARGLRARVRLPVA